MHSAVEGDLLCVCWGGDAPPALGACSLVLRSLAICKEGNGALLFVKCW
jgi:hypothetical protein